VFIDLVKITVKAGNGGDGIVRFRREKFVAYGGPDGGDGGKGGDVIVAVNPGMSTLIDFRYRRKYKADDGNKGEGSNCNGRHGDDIVIEVPPGTVIKDSDTGRIIADMDETGKRFILAKGGRGGKGNQHFANSVRQAPRFATPGVPGQELEVVLELKLIADVGLAGFPNAGKSTLISSVTKSRPKIADYPFTTLEPNLGVVSLGTDMNFVIADIPGIIEGASEGAGLGLEFLRHIERTKLLFIMIDLAQTDGKDVIYAYEHIFEEIGKYSKRLAARPRFIVGNKNDVTDSKDNDKRLGDRAIKDGYEYHSISAVTQKGVSDLIKKAYEKLSTLPRSLVFDPKDEAVIMTDEKEEQYNVEKIKGIYVIDGPLAKKIFMSTNFDDQESIQYFQRTLKNRGIIAKLEELGIEEGDTVRIFDMEFEYLR
jgi:GTPase